MKIMTKQGLRDFIDDKVIAQKKALEEKIKATIDAKITPIVERMIIGYDGIERRADVLAQEVDALGEIFWTAGSWDIRQVTQKLNQHIVDFRSDFKSKTLEKFYQCELYSHGGHMAFKNDELQAALQQLFEETHDLHEKIKQLNRAKSEITTAIGNESTAKKAYNAVVALGIDLRDYEEVAKLPAVVKLSVDPCLINGDCG